MLRAFLSDELGLSTAEGSLLQIILAPGAYVFWESLQALRAQVPISFVDETSGRFIDKKRGGLRHHAQARHGGKCSADFHRLGGHDHSGGDAVRDARRAGLCDRRSADAG